MNECPIGYVELPETILLWLLVIEHYKPYFYCTSIVMNVVYVETFSFINGKRIIGETSCYGTSLWWYFLLTFRSVKLMLKYEFWSFFELNQFIFLQKRHNDL